jgi:hypothetical protein
MKTRQTSSDDSLGISVRSSEPTAEIGIENVENGNVRNCHFTDDDRYQVRTKKGKQHFSDYFFPLRRICFKKNDHWNTYRPFA